uniref:Uncharacterized protein n=1 Tax=Oryza sativa subsp. japonica TaxID=39947 RepID=Q6K2E6_ORYSJ|nr:hypothetical protein [Oryza sativa Japonica Group]
MHVRPRCIQGGMDFGAATDDAQGRDLCANDADEEESVFVATRNMNIGGLPAMWMAGGGFVSIPDVWTCVKRGHVSGHLSICICDYGALCAHE